MNHAVPVIAGSYDQYRKYIRERGLRDLRDTFYPPSPEWLDGRPMGSVVVLTGDYAARDDWPKFKLSMDSFRAALQTDDGDGMTDRTDPDRPASSSATLTPHELAILDCLASAWNQFVKLGEKHPDDDAEFRHAIHAAQAIVACRVAKRVDPHLWS